MIGLARGSGSSYLQERPPKGGRGEKAKSVKAISDPVIRQLLTFEKIPPRLTFFISQRL